MAVRVPEWDRCVHLRTLLEGIERYFSTPLSDADVAALDQVLTTLIRANEPS